MLDSRAPLTYLPLASRVEVVNTAQLGEISVDDVYSSAQQLLVGRAK